MNSDLERELSQAMQTTFAGPFSSPELAHRVVAAHKQTQRRRLVIIVAASAIAFSLVGAAALLQHLSAKHSVLSTASVPVKPSAGPANDYVDDGDLVSVSGLVRVSPNGDAILCPPGESSTSAVEPPCGSTALALSSVDLTRLGSVRRSGGETLGFAQFTGKWTPSRLEVQDQFPLANLTTLDSDLDLPLSSSEHVPCAPPVGGWRKGRDFDWSAFLTYAQINPSLVVGYSSARPDPSTLVITAAVTNAQAVRQALPQYAGKLCLVSSRYTASQVAKTVLAAQQLDATGNALLDNGLSGYSKGVLGPSGQVQLSLEVVVRDRRVAQVEAFAPSGLLRVYAWVTPAHQPVSRETCFAGTC